MAADLSARETIRARNAYGQYVAKVQAVGQEHMSFKEYVEKVWLPQRPRKVE